MDLRDSLVLVSVLQISLYPVARSNFRGPAVAVLGREQQWSCIWVFQILAPHSADLWWHIKVAGPAPDPDGMAIECGGIVRVAHLDHKRILSSELRDRFVTTAEAPMITTGRYRSVGTTQGVARQD